MAHKFYTSGKYFYIENPDTLEKQTSLLEDVFIFEAENTTTPSFYVRGTNISQNLYKFSDIVDASGLAFSDVTAFKTFYENFKTGGGSPQPPVIDDATPTKKGVAKIYNSTGQNVDGSMTQKAITNAITDAIPVILPPELNADQLASINANPSLNANNPVASKQDLQNGFGEIVIYDPFQLIFIDLDTAVTYTQSFLSNPIENASYKFGIFKFIVQQNTIASLGFLTNITNPRSITNAYFKFYDNLGLINSYLINCFSSNSVEFEIYLSDNLTLSDNCITDNLEKLKIVIGDNVFFGKNCISNNLVKIDLKIGFNLNSNILFLKKAIFNKQSSIGSILSVGIGSLNNATGFLKIGTNNGFFGEDNTLTFNNSFVDCTDFTLIVPSVLLISDNGNPGANLQQAINNGVNILTNDYILPSPRQLEVYNGNSFNVPKFCRISNIINKDNLQAVIIYNHDKGINQVTIDNTLNTCSNTDTLEITFN